MLFCDVFLFLVKNGTPSDDDLERISHELGNWRLLGRALKFREATLTKIDNKYEDLRRKGYEMLLHWKAREGSAATCMVLHDALCHRLVMRKDLAEILWVDSDLPQFTTGNMSLILQFNNNTITYKYSA